MGSIFGIEIPLIPQSFLDKIAAELLRIFGPILKPITGALNLFSHFKEETVGTAEDMKALVDNAIAAYQQLHEFSVNFDKDAKHRVVETVRAYQQIRRMAIDIPVEIWERCKDLVQVFKSLTSSTAEAEELLAEVQGVQDLKAALSKIGPRFAKAIGKIFEWIGFIDTELVAVHKTISDLLTIVNDLREEIEKINRLNFIFLPQNNSRERVKLENGETIYRRIPKTPIN